MQTFKGKLVNKKRKLVNKKHKMVNKNKIHKFKYTEYGINTKN